MKRTYQPKKLKQKRKFGFLSRKRSKGGKNIIMNRIRKNRWRITY